MSILPQIHIDLASIIAEAERLAKTAINYLKDVAISAAQKAVSLVKETKLGTAIMNLISAASLSSASGADKFAAVLAASEGAYQAFVDNGGLKGLFDLGVSVLRQVIQSLYDDFITKFITPSAA